MSSVLSMYTVMQHSEWAGRQFYLVCERNTGQVLHLLAEPARGAPEAYQHQHLPQLELLVAEDGERWWMAPLAEGSSLEELRARGELSEREILAVMLSVVDALACLNVLSPPLALGYLDPACILRDQSGRWFLDYLTLAHAPEVRSLPATSSGVHAFGALLYWLISGKKAQLNMVQLRKVKGRISATLQYILIRCLGQSYSSIGDLRADLEQAGNEHEFQALVTALASPSADPGVTGECEALSPQRDLDYRKLSLGIAPSGVGRRFARWGSIAAAGVTVLLVAVEVTLRVGAPPSGVELPAKVYPELAKAEAQIGEGWGGPTTAE